ncbi:glycosyltransferase [Corynebacterium yudongzhengii]|uniref:Glycosyltransferase n=1 Tax=Corynebacterium yudongzhengii TaxID=2080740 RepID=A0A2U1T4R9_9CORY|nr:glycosyltransferase [Corynebacterium yudongzhengii]AWB82900.1 glycosyltransferase [Corynebacterium yudongzhengii]PWC00997.1 glycosyltransferase [Corynebacterium yudongzhengii]
MPTLSVLISSYHGNDPVQLSAALSSLIAQTRPADEIVIVIDGPIPDRLRQVIDGFCASEPSARTVELETNQGLGPACQAGLETISSDFIARLDADDIAYPERFATQLEAFARDPDLDVCGTAVAEFQKHPGDGDNVRRMPESHEEILKYLRINTPVNHPSVMMRTDAVRAAGGYRDVHFMEDYDLWARLATGGYRFVNLPEPLTYFRVSDEQFGRRTGKEMFAADAQMQRNLVHYGLISQPRAVLNMLVRSAYRLLPAPLLRRVYSRLFHR